MKFAIKVICFACSLLLTVPMFGEASRHGEYSVLHTALCFHRRTYLNFFFNTISEQKHLTLDEDKPRNVLTSKHDRYVLIVINHLLT